MDILLIQLKRIGDLILTTPAIAAVREKFPDAHLTLVISSEGKALAPAIAGVNKLLVMPRGLAGFGTGAAIARGKFDFDVVGHYARPDVFTLSVDGRPKPPVTFQP